MDGESGYHGEGLEMRMAKRRLWWPWGSGGLGKLQSLKKKGWTAHRNVDTLMHIRDGPIAPAHDVTSSMSFTHRRTRWDKFTIGWDCLDSVRLSWTNIVYTLALVC